MDAVSGTRTAGRRATLLPTPASWENVAYGAPHPAGDVALEALRARLRPINAEFVSQEAKSALIGRVRGGGRACEVRKACGTCREPSARGRTRPGMRTWARTQGARARATGESTGRMRPANFGPPCRRRSPAGRIRRTLDAPAADDTPAPKACSGKIRPTEGALPQDAPHRERGVAQTQTQGVGAAGAISANAGPTPQLTPHLHQRHATAGRAPHRERGGTCREATPP